MVLTSAGRGLLWQEWDGNFIVYQPASAETHVFNETTALILRFLEEGAAPAPRLLERVAEALGLEQGREGLGDVRFALDRLEALGLIDRADEAPSAP